MKAALALIALTILSGCALQPWTEADKKLMSRHRSNLLGPVWVFQMDEQRERDNLNNLQPIYKRD